MEIFGRYASTVEIGIGIVVLLVIVWLVAEFTFPYEDEPKQQEKHVAKKGKTKN